MNPTRSAKRTVTRFRSSRAGSASTSAAPHARQNRARSGFSSPHCRQAGMWGSLGRYLMMFTARAATRRIATAENADSMNMASLARRVSGIASVGLNAIELVNET